MGETLGTGSFGRVKITKNKKTGEYIAMKIMKKSEILKSKQADHISNGIKILSMMEHSFIIKFRDYTQDDRNLYLNLENILIHQSGYLKLTDFGFAKIVESRTYILCGIPEYLPPEIILNKGHGKPVDWWTTGILLYEMIAGIDPFSDDDPMMVYQKILKGKIKFPSGFDSNAKSIIKHL